MKPEWIGWSAAAVLVYTISRQVWVDWHEPPGESATFGLYIGQIVTSSGFLAYALLQRDAVFAVANAVLLLAALAGIIICARRRRAEKGSAKDATSAPVGTMS